MLVAQYKISADLKFSMQHVYRNIEKWSISLYKVGNQYMCLRLQILMAGRNLDKNY